MVKLQEVVLDLTKRLKDDEFAREYVAMVEGDAEKQSERIAELEAQVAEMRKLLVRVKMYVPDSQQDLHSRIHYATEQ